VPFRAKNLERKNRSPKGQPFERPLDARTYGRVREERWEEADTFDADTGYGKRLPLRSSQPFIELCAACSLISLAIRAMSLTY